MARRTYRGASVATTLAGSLTAGVTTATLASGGGTSMPDAIAGPFVITVNVGGATEEKILVGVRTGDNLSNLTRGYDGTVAAAHAAGESVRHTISAVDLDEANGHINDTTLDQHTQYAKRGQGLAANVGGASRAGRLYIATDTEDLYADDGGAVHRYLSKPSSDAAYVAKADAATALVTPPESTASGTYTDLTTVGPTVTVTVGASGRVRVEISAWLSSNTANGTAFMDFAASGGNTRAAGTLDSTLFAGSAYAGQQFSMTKSYILTGLAAGSTTFTAKYSASGGTASFQNRRIIVTPL